ncbi:SsrA-binding protein SmpB [Candidatus Saccharibacteria bacterium]|nr:SsrA-binding protein SmpB [Candidatus Saccharibacteria bacterium]
MKIIAKNKRAYFDYGIEDTLLAGVMLSGPEVKSARSGHVQLKGSYVQIIGGELWLVNTHISAYKFASEQPHEETRSRKLLVTSKQFEELKAAKQNGRHLVPTAMGAHGRFIKIEIGIGKSKKNTDKRQTISDRQTSRELNREIKQQQYR